MADLIATSFPEEMATAEGLLFSSARQQPTNAAAHIAYASFLVTHMNSPMAADAAFRRALELKPKDAALRANYAAFLERQFYATHVDPNEPGGGHPSYSQKLVSSFSHPALVETMKIYDEAERMDPRNSHVKFLKGYSLYRRHRIAEAWLSYQQALSLDPNNVQIVKAAAVFVHERYTSVAMGIAAMARTSTAQEGAQLSQLASLAQALYTKAIQLEAGAAADVHFIGNYAAFLSNVLQKPAEGAKVAELAYAAVTRAREQTAKEAAESSSTTGDEATDPDDLLG
jgi:Tfp pilus assembly protein PilF